MGRHLVRIISFLFFNLFRPLIYTAMISIGIEIYREYLNSNFESVYDVYTMRIVSVFSSRSNFWKYLKEYFSVLMILVYIAIMYQGSDPLMIALSLMVIVNNFVCVQAAVMDIIGFFTSFREVCILHWFPNSKKSFRKTLTWGTSSFSSSTWRTFSIRRSFFSNYTLFATLSWISTLGGSELLNSIKRAATVENRTNRALRSRAMKLRMEHRHFVQLKLLFRNHTIKHDIITSLNCSLIKIPNPGSS